MAGTQVKPHSRVLGFDDGPFRRGDQRVPVVGVLSRAPNYVEGMLVTDVGVDGNDATDAIVRAAASSGHATAASLVLIDGATMGGFNVVDIDTVHRATDTPVASVARDRPDMPAIERALRGRFDDWRERLDVLQRHRIEELPLDEGAPLWVQRVGIDAPTLGRLVRSHTVRGRTPDPLRVAHLAATALVEGRSRGA